MPQKLLYFPEEPPVAARDWC